MSGNLYLQICRSWVLNGDLMENSRPPHFSGLELSELIERRFIGRFIAAERLRFMGNLHCNSAQWDLLGCGAREEK